MTHTANTLPPLPEPDDLGHEVRWAYTADSVLSIQADAYEAGRRAALAQSAQAPAQCHWHECPHGAECVHAQAPAMPPLTDTMRAVLRNEHDVYGDEDALYAALCEAAQERIDTAACGLPTFEVRHEGGLDAVVQNILDATNALSARAEAAQRVPQKWQRVPADPTEDMLVIGQEAWAHARAQRNAVEDCTEARAVYEAMLAAAPDAPQAAQRVPQGWKPVPVEPTPEMAAPTAQGWAVERAADMLTAYTEMIKATGRYAEEHYIPEVEEVIEALRVAAATATEPKGAPHAQE